MTAHAFYYFAPHPDVALVPWLEPGAQEGTFVAECKGVHNPFTNIPRAASLAEATAAWIPNNFRQPTPSMEAYIRASIDAAVAAGVPVFLFSCGDLSDRVRFDPRAYVFRYSTYRSALRPEDIVAPTLTDDLGSAGIQIRAKAERATVSFCGKASFKSRSEWIKYYLKVAFFSSLSVVFPPAKARIVGVYWRRRALNACARSKDILTYFIIRRTFSGAQSTIELDPVQAHQEFLASIRDSDFVLAPKGDGNYSNRFLEALSLGRIPVLIDTDYVSPLEGHIDYARIIVTVPMRETNRLPQYVRSWYDALDADQWRERQEEARAIYETRLRFDAFYTYFFEQVLPSLPRLPQRATP